MHGSIGGRWGHGSNTAGAAGPGPVAQRRHHTAWAGPQPQQQRSAEPAAYLTCASSKPSRYSGTLCLRGRHHRAVRRVAIIGNSGAGKSTLGRILADRLDVPYVELDGIFHQRNWSKLPPAEFERRVAAVADQPRWILDGSYSAVRHVIWPRADCVVWIDLPRLLVTYRVLRRTVHRCATGQELWNGNRDRWQDMFSTDPMTSTVAAAWKRYPEQRARLAAATTDPEWAQLTFVHLRSRRQVRQYLHRLSQDHDREPG
jgi:adenylate kinase family enzyme